MSTSRRVFQTTALPSCFAPLLNDWKARVRAAWVRAVLSVNRGNENGAYGFSKSVKTPGEPNVCKLPGDEV